jgi:hypothetical protein
MAVQAIEVGQFAGVGRAAIRGKYISQRFHARSVAAC